VTKTSAPRQYLDVKPPDPPPGPGLEGFDAVYEREFTYIWKTLGRLGVPSADIADAVHDVFIVVYRRWSEVDPDRPIRPWLFGIARRIASGRRRKRPDLLVDLDRPVHDRDAHARRDLLWRALSALAEDRLEVIVLHDLEGRTGLEIAELLGIPPNTVHSRLRLARADLAAAVDRLRGGR
jgi:RNA polymerase sigma-70 factor (ECF subfamily)